MVLIPSKKTHLWIVLIDSCWRARCALQADSDWTARPREEQALHPVPRRHPGTNPRTDIKVILLSPGNISYWSYWYNTCLEYFGYATGKTLFILANLHWLKKKLLFCQGIQYECVESPITDAGYYDIYNGSSVSSFGTGYASSTEGCACTLTNTCPAGRLCHCDAKGRLSLHTC